MNERVKALERWVGQPGASVHDMTDDELEIVLARALGISPEEAHALSDEELEAIIAAGRKP